MGFNLSIDSVDQLQQTLKANQRYGLALDIDDTLAQAAQYLLEQIHLDLKLPMDKPIEELFKEYGKYTGEFWNRADVNRWFNNVRHLKTENLPLMPDAHEMVQRINAIVPIRAYITARRQDHYAWTQAWLDQHNFPKAPLICQPNNEKYDNSHAWKARVLEDLYPNIVGIVDDNELLAHELSSDYPGTHYLYGYKECARDNIDVVCCQDWDNVYQEIRKRYLGK